MKRREKKGGKLWYNFVFLIVFALFFFLMSTCNWLICIDASLALEMPLHANISGDSVVADIGSLISPSFGSHMWYKRSIHSFIQVFHLFFGTFKMYKIFRTALVNVTHKNKSSLQRFYTAYIYLVALYKRIPD